MTKNKKNLTQDEFEAALQSMPAEVETTTPFTADSVALSIVSDGKGGFNIVKVHLDSVNLTAGTVEVLENVPTKYEASDRFKFAVVQNGIL
jgi:hypothetical protein